MSSAGRRSLRSGCGRARPDHRRAWSDNAAANAQIESVGGPEAVTAFLRSIGDDTTRMDRIEPDLNTHDHEGHERGTTTPLAMMMTLLNLLLGDALTPS
ncbi:hypothetical protein FZZ93_07460 [Halomonas eurihalina]|uniref:Beta-lactamase class A catalytic domain-containing protein n=1 Tax=Halomonas eurihalina TaxID=42566 RepID=A0A5D9D8J1_HALER|nr:hypothetical protein FZZ93_07460 [Halomonas eurihalina]